MAAHRYWKADLLRTAGKTSLQLSEFQLFAAGVRVDAAATLTATTAPTTGSLVALTDNDTGTDVEWVYPSYLGAALQWDFGGSPSDVDDIRLGAVNAAANFLRNVRIQYSDDAVTWVDYYTFELISWPGARAKTASSTKAIPVGATATLQQLFAEFEGTNGQTTFTDSSVNAVTLTGVGGPTLSSAVAPPNGTTSLLLNGTSQYVTLTPLTKLVSNNPGVTTWEFDFRTTTTATRQTLFSWVSNQSYTQQIYVEENTGLLRFNLSSASAVGPPVNDGKWHKIAIVLNNVTTPLMSLASKSSIYLDGKLVGYTSVSTGFSVGVANVSAWIGAHRTTASATAVDFFNGNIKNVIISQSLTTPRFSQNYVPFLGLGAGLATINTDLYTRVPTSRGATVPTLGLQPATPSVQRFFGTPKDRKGTKDYYATSTTGLFVGRLAGTVKEDGTPDMPVVRKVRLLRERDGVQLRETWSAPGTGSYSFDWIDETETYLVYSLDYEHDFRGVLADNLTLANGGVTLMAPILPQAPYVFVRNARSTLYAAAGATNMIFPALVADGDLLMVVMQTGSATPSITARWTLRGVQSYVASTGSTRYIHVFTTTGRAADSGQAETVSFSVADRSHYLTLAIAQSNGKQPVVTAFSSAVINTNANQAIAVPDVTTGNGERLGIAVGASINANNTPTLTNWAISGGPWTSLMSASLDQLRMSAWSKPLVDPVLSMAGTITVDQSLGANNGLAAATIVVSPAP